MEEGVSEGRGVDRVGGGEEVGAEAAQGRRAKFRPTCSLRSGCHWLIAAVGGRGLWRKKPGLFQRTRRRAAPKQ